MATSPTELRASSATAGLTPLPAKLPQLDGLHMKARYRADRRGGDFFDGVVAGPRVVFLLTDIAGRRAEAHPIAAEVQVIFRAKAQEIFEPSTANESDGIAQLAWHLNRAIIDAAHGVRMAPAFVGCFNLSLGILTYHNAGLLAIFRDREGVRVLETGGIPMGLFTHLTYEPALLAFEPGARLLLVTKGVSERRRGSATFGGESIRRLVENSNTDSASQICDAVLQAAHEFRSHPLSRFYDFLHPRRRSEHDDLTALTLVRAG